MVLSDSIKELYPFFTNKKINKIADSIECHIKQGQCFSGIIKNDRVIRDPTNGMFFGMAENNEVTTKFLVVVVDGSGTVLLDGKLTKVKPDVYKVSTSFKVINDSYITYFVVRICYISKIQQEIYNWREAEKEMEILRKTEETEHIKRMEEKARSNREYAERHKDEINSN